MKEDEGEVFSGITVWGTCIKDIEAGAVRGRDRAFDRHERTDAVGRNLVTEVLSYSELTRPSGAGTM